MPSRQILRNKNQRGAALFVVLLLGTVIAGLIGTMSLNIMGQNKDNRRSSSYEKAMLHAEIGVQRIITALAHENDAISWEMRKLTSAPSSPPTDFWLWQWQSISDENGNEIGRYRIEIMPLNSNKKIMYLKAIGIAFPRKDNGQPAESVRRSFGVELKQLTLGDFAIATNHQLGGARINGGARIHGGILTSGELHLDASSTGIFNDYVDLDSNQNFDTYNAPSESPDGEVFVYKDPNITVGNNGMVKLASQASMGTADKPMQKIHIAEDSLVADPGNGNPGTEGDGIIGNGEERAKGLKDHKLPDIQFPDASENSSFMKARKADAQVNGQAIYLGDISFGSTSFTIGQSPALSYDGSTGIISINGAVYIEGDVTVSGPLKYSGKGSLFIQGNFTATQSIEPIAPSLFPDQHAMGIVCSDDMELGQNSGSSSKYAGFFFGNNSISIKKAKVYGNVFGNTINLPTTGTRPDIYVHPEVMGATNVELPDFNQAEIIKNLWWEMNGTAAR